MLNVNLLKSEMVKNGYTQKDVSKALAMSERTFYNRLKTGDFGRDEIEKLITFLKLEKPLDIFFAAQ